MQFYMQAYSLKNLDQSYKHCMDKAQVNFPCWQHITELLHIVVEKTNTLGNSTVKELCTYLSAFVL